VWVGMPGMRWENLIIEEPTTYMYISLLMPENKI
jgi:hypothetical protein